MFPRTAIVTGANSGIGLATTRALAKRGYRVIMACRSLERSTVAWNRVRRDAASDQVFLLHCDLASLASVRRFAAEFTTRFDRLDALVNNAGIVTRERHLTEDGFEMMLEVGYIGHYLLTRLLLDRLREGEPSRVVNLAGSNYRRGTLELNDINFDSRPFSMMDANAQTQLSRVLFTRELARRVRSERVVCNAVHPGAVLTEAQRTLPAYLRVLIHTVLRPGFVRPAAGARPVVRLAVGDDMDGGSGVYFDRHTPRDTPGMAQDELLGRRLWNWTEAACALDELPRVETVSDGVSTAERTLQNT